MEKNFYGFNVFAEYICDGCYHQTSIKFIIEIKIHFISEFFFKIEEPFKKLNLN